MCVTVVVVVRSGDDRSGFGGRRGCGDISAENGSEMI